MMRAIVAVIFGWLIWSVWKKLMLRQGSKKTVADPTPREISGEMVACKACGTFVLTSECLSAGGNVFCSSTCMNNSKSN